MNALSTTLRAAGILAVLLLAGLGILLVLDVISRDLFTQWSVKAVAIVGILAAAGLLMGLLLKKRAS